MGNFQPDENILKKIAERVMFDSVHEGVDVTDPKALHDLVSEVVKAIIGEANPELVEAYVKTAISDMYREETMDEIGPQGYFDRMRGALANEHRNPSHK